MTKTKMIYLFLFFSGLGLALVKCTSSGYSAGQVVEILKSSNDEEINNFCEGTGCCKTSRVCLRTCQKIFRDNRRVPEFGGNFARERNICRGLSRNLVRKLDGLNSLLRIPSRGELRRVNINEEFSLYLTIGGVDKLGQTIYSYTKDQARELLYWFAENEDVAREIKELQDHEELIDFLLSTFGGRDNVDPAEVGLGKGLFKVMDDNGNQTLINIVHNVIRYRLCEPKNSSEDQINLCILRIYCKEHKNHDGVYVHTEDLRNNIIREVEDESLNNFIFDEVLQVGYGRGGKASEISNQVCEYVCEDARRGCE